LILRVAIWAKTMYAGRDDPGHEHRISDGKLADAEKRAAFKGTPSCFSTCSGCPGAGAISAPLASAANPQRRAER
jgi:hypothetical protein